MHEYSTNARGGVVPRGFGDPVAATPAAGVYGPDGKYYYRWNPSSNSLEFAYAGKAWTPVPLSSSAGVAIYKKLPYLVKLTKDQVSSLGLSARSQATAVATTPPGTFSPSPASLPATPAAPVSSEVLVPFYKEPWFLPAAILGVVVIVGGVLIARNP